MTPLNNDYDIVRDIAHYAYLASKTYDSPKIVQDKLTNKSLLFGETIKSFYFLSSPRFCENYSGDHPLAGFIASTKNTVIIALRGTRVKSPNYDDLIFDLLAFPDQQGFHLGFRLYADLVWQQLGNFLFQNNNHQKQIIVTGHSLGAATAKIITYYLNENGFTNPYQLQTYVFGSPTASIFPLELRTPLYAFNNSIDIVPYLIQEIAPQVIYEMLIPSTNWLSDLLPFIPWNILVNPLSQTAEVLAQYRHIQSKHQVEYLIGDYGICRVDEVDDNIFAQLQGVDFTHAFINDTKMLQDIQSLLTEIMGGKFNRFLGVVISALYGRFLYKHEMRIYAKSLNLPIDQEEHFQKFTPDITIHPQSQFIFAAQEIINFEQLKGRIEWKSQALGMIVGAIWQFNANGIFFYAPANGRTDIFPLQGNYTTEGNKVFFEGMTSFSVSASIASTWCFGEIDFTVNPPIMNMEWGNGSSTAAMVSNTLFNSNLSSAYRTTIVLRQVFERTNIKER